MHRHLIFICLTLSLTCFAQTPPQADDRPNVILVLTDDQGIGDLSCHDNPWLKTPNIDAFYTNSVRLTDFHVSPLCTPTRAAIMTGRYPINNGAWATYKGRDALSEGAVTMANVFQQGGYKTGLFGKWHLGDNYPTRPTDLGFNQAVHHLAGGVGELSDHWGNTYFDDTYYVNNKPREFKGYCTDVWFREAMNFMKNADGAPFFIYLPTNAPHDPWYVAEEYVYPYKHLEKNEIVSANFFGMLANLDENFGKLEDFLQTTGLADNTILIFMSDNGSRGGISADGKTGYNMGFRGRKGDVTDGGHRVPFFIRWKDGKLTGGRDINEVTAHVDLLPTLARLCGIDLPKELPLDGIDLSPLLRGEQLKPAERTIFLHNRQDWRPPLEVGQTCLINGSWRLVNGKELYDIKKDRFQKINLAEEYPGVVTRLLAENSAFVKKARSKLEHREFPTAIIGSPHQDEIKLTVQHAIGEGPGFWKSEQVAAGLKSTNNMHALMVERPGKYLISCRRWPQECPGPILGIPIKNPKNWFTYQTIAPNKVRIQIANQLHEKEIRAEDEEVTFALNLAAGKTFLTVDFIEGKEKYGVYYTYIKSLD